MRFLIIAALLIVAGCTLPRGRPTYPPLPGDKSAIATGTQVAPKALAVPQPKHYTLIVINAPDTNADLYTTTIYSSTNLIDWHPLAETNYAETVIYGFTSDSWREFFTATNWFK